MADAPEPASAAPASAPPTAGGGENKRKGAGGPLVTKASKKAAKASGGVQQFPIGREPKVTLELLLVLLLLPVLTSVLKGSTGWSARNGRWEDTRRSAFWGVHGSARTWISMETNEPLEVRLHNRVVGEKQPRKPSGGGGGGGEGGGGAALPEPVEEAAAVSSWGAEKQGAAQAVGGKRKESGVGR